MNILCDLSSFTIVSHSLSDNIKTLFKTIHKLDSINSTVVSKYFYFHTRLPHKIFRNPQKHDRALTTIFISVSLKLDSGERVILRFFQTELSLRITRNDKTIESILWDKDTARSKIVKCCSQLILGIFINVTSKKK